MGVTTGVLLFEVMCVRMYVASVGLLLLPTSSTPCLAALRYQQAKSTVTITKTAFYPTKKEVRKRKGHQQRVTSQERRSNKEATAAVDDDEMIVGRAEATTHDTTTIRDCKAGKNGKPAHEREVQRRSGARARTHDCATTSKIDENGFAFTRPVNTFQKMTKKIR